MKPDKVELCWMISLFVIGVAAIILAGSNLMGIELPDAVKITAGVCDLIALPVLAYTTVKKLKKTK